MKIAILDDETHCVESLVIHINSLFPEATIAYKSTKPKEALEVLKRIEIDILFLDVEMPIMDGFEFLDQFGEINFDVIFTTAYSQYAIQAFKAQAVNYLLKPIDEDELKDAINQQIKSKENLKNKSSDVSNLLEHFRKESILSNKIAIPTTDGIELIDICEIIYCNSQSNYTVIYTLSGKPITISKTLKEMEKCLEKFTFIRVHQSFLVNSKHIKKYIRNDGGFLLMVDNSQIPISQSKKSSVINFFEKLNTIGN